MHQLFNSIMMKNILRISVLALTVSLTSCSKDDEAIAAPINNNTTTNTISSVGCDAKVPYMQNGFKANYAYYSDNEDLGDSQSFEYSCVGNQLVRKTLFSVWGQNSESSNIVMVQNNYISVKSSTTSNLRKPYKHDAKLGETWSNLKDNGATETYLVMAVDSMVTVPAGTYSCKLIKRTATDSAIPDMALYSDEVGLVYQEVPFLGTLKLKSFTK